MSYHDKIVVANLAPWGYARAVRPARYDQVLRAVSRRVRSARLDLGLSQEEAAHRAGIATRQWQRVEAGEAITLRTLIAAAAALDADLSDLLRR